MSSPLLRSWLSLLEDRPCGGLTYGLAHGVLGCIDCVGDQNTDLGGNEIFMRPLKILVEVGRGRVRYCLEDQENLVWPLNISHCLGN